MKNIPPPEAVLSGTGMQEVNYKPTESMPVADMSLAHYRCPPAFSSSQSYLRPAPLAITTGQ